MWASEDLAPLLEPAVGKVYRYIRRVLADEAREQCLTLTQVNALRYLLLGGQKRMSELAQLLELSGSACTTMIDQLEKRGLVSKTLDESDRRATLVATTAEGQALGRRIIGVLYRNLAEHMQALGISERYMVLGGFEALARVIE